MNNLYKTTLKQRQIELDQLKETSNIKDRRLVTNAKLEANLNKIFYSLLSQFGPECEAMLGFIAIAVSLDEIGKATSHLPFHFKEEYIGEIILPIFFHDCDSIDDVLNAFTEGPVKYTISKPYVRRFKEKLNLEFGFFWNTCMFIDKIKSMIPNPNTGDLLFNIITPKDTKEGKYIIYQKNDELKTQIMIDISDIYDIKLFDPKKTENGILNWIRRHLCIFD